MPFVRSVFVTFGVASCLAGCVPPGESPLSQPELASPSEALAQTGTPAAPAPTVTPAQPSGVIQLSQIRPGGAAEQRALADIEAGYRNEPGQRAVAGAVAGLLICQIADCPRGTSVQAVAQGALIGAGESGYLAGRGASFRPTTATFAQDLQQAERESARMLQAATAAEAALAFQRRQSASLRAGFAAGTVPAASYVTAIETFGHDAQVTQSLIATVNVRVNRLQISANDHRIIGPSSSLLFNQLTVQQQALARLQRARQGMLAVIGEAPAGLVR